jgi:hypothetical protein
MPPRRRCTRSHALLQQLPAVAAVQGAFAGAQTHLPFAQLSLQHCASAVHAAVRPLRPSTPKVEAHGVEMPVTADDVLLTSRAPPRWTNG